MIGALLVLGLWAPNADVPLIEAAVAQVKAGRPAEALRLLEPIGADDRRINALTARDRLLLFYTIGRAHEENADGCAAYDAFSRARKARRIRRRERKRLDAAIARVADLRGGSLTVSCTDAAEVAGQRRRCPFTVGKLPPGEAVEVRFWLGAFAFTPVTTPIRRCETTQVDMPAPGRLIVRGGPVARVNGERITLPATLDVPPGRYTIAAGETRQVVQVAANRTEEVQLRDTTPAAVTPSRPSAMPWIITGVLAAGAAATGTMALVKGGEHATAQDAVNTGRSTDRAKVFALEDETNAYAIGALVLSLATASGLVWAFLSADDARAYVTPGGIGWRF